VSVTTPTLAEDKQSRKAFEDALIAVYRREMGESPTANFGRIIDGYRQSTYRSGEERGGPLEPGQTVSNTEDGVVPLDWSRSSDVLSEDWMGILWSSPRPLADADTSIPTDDGLYRIWREGEAPPLEYIGQSSNLKSRLYRHRRNRHEALLFSYSELGITMSNTSAKRLRRSLSAFTGWKLGRVHKISSDVIPLYLIAHV